MKINLTKGLQAIVDDEDYAYISTFSWHASAKNYAASSDVVNGKRKGLLMHRIIMNAPHGLTVDHINGNKLDNRKENLRLATMQENSWNRSVRGSSGFLGVRRAGKSWIAVIYPNLKVLSLGTYKTRELAGAAFNEAAKIIYGNFAKLNNVPEVFGLMEAEILKREKAIKRLNSEIEILKGNK